MTMNKHTKTIKWPIEFTAEDHQQFEQLAVKLSENFNALLMEEGIDKHTLPDTVLAELYLPLTAWLLKKHCGKTLFAGINGAQGSGKSTLCKILQLLIEQGFEKRVATLSIDDLYLTRQQRAELAKQVHPLLQTRGVPGTHDVALGLSLFEQLRAPHGELSLPRFNKAIDDRAPIEQWPSLSLPVEVVLFEGWCVASQPQPSSTLAEPINALELQEDGEGIWRHYVNQQLSGDYQTLFKQLDTLIMLKIPAMEKVLEWRSLQEQKLATNQTDQSGVMTEQQVARFIMHYERITRDNLEHMPARADLVLTLNDDHQINAVAAKALL